MPAPINNALLFLIQIVFNAYSFILMLRLLLQFFGADFFNPLSQFIVKVTQPIVKPLQRVLPKLKGVDLAIVLLLFVIEAIRITMVVWLQSGVIISPASLFVSSLGLLLRQLLNLFFYAIILRVLLSWFPTQSASPVTHILYVLTEPLLRRARQIIPPIGGLDLSPIAVILLLKFTVILIVNPLIT